MTKDKNGKKKQCWKLVGPDSKSPKTAEKNVNIVKSVYVEL